MRAAGAALAALGGGRPAAGRQRRAPVSRAQGYGGRRTGSYQLLAFPRGEKARARLGGEGGERDKNRVRRSVPRTARRHPRPCAEAAAGLAPPAPRQGSGARRDAGAGQRGGAAGAAAAKAGAAAGWTPRPGTPGQPGLGAAGAVPGCPEKAWEQDAAGVWGRRGRAPALITSLQLWLFSSPGGECEQSPGQDRPPRSSPTSPRSQGVGGRHRLRSGGAKPPHRSLEGHELSPA